ncbi:DUF2304 domain-containing protein [Actinomadura barringtoniae]|uniref:DUF2304 domain-containing protein n=1 Tax=Actinomadura barringtoniae TaxID=1427535 RepID=A0A939P990_9ACTN|nr:DUF2304 domain-containing protein [Actinomadura barringtoniae]MBO2448467.1 DUF2304 domain-containing protein [Actinomadura barringtoniae]
MDAHVPGALLMTVYQLGLAGAAISLLVIFEMLRRRRLREKYAITWVVVALFIVVIAVFPGVLTWAAELTGVEVPANLLFFGASLVLLALNVQLSSEVSRLEDKVRTLAEELGLQRLLLQQLEQAAAEREDAGHEKGTGGEVHEISEGP